MLSRKDYKAIAEIIKQEFTAFDDTGEDDYEGKHATISISKRLADYFAAENPQFNRDRFMKACGL